LTYPLQFAKLPIVSVFKAHPFCNEAPSASYRTYMQLSITLHRTRTGRDLVFQVGFLCHAVEVPKYEYEVYITEKTA
jgi:hypothetical protein